MLSPLLLLLGCGAVYIDGPRRTPADSPAPASPGDTADGDTADDDTADGDTAQDTSHSGDTGLPPLEGDPCVRALPADALVVTGEVTSEDDHVSAWVCRAGMYSTSGASGQVYVESRGDAVLAGSGSRAWIRASGRIHVYAGPNELWVEEGAEVSVEAEGVLIHTCPAITFTGGPAGGC